MDNKQIKNVSFDEYNALLNTNKHLQDTNGLLKGKIQEMENNIQKVKVTLVSESPTSWDDFENCRAVRSLSYSYENIEDVKNLLAKAAEVKNSIKVKELNDELKRKEDDQYTRAKYNITKYDNLHEDYKELKKLKNTRINELSEQIFEEERKAIKQSDDHNKEIKKLRDEVEKQVAKLDKTIENLQADLLLEKSRGLLNRIIVNFTTNSVIKRLINSIEVKQSITRKIDDIKRKITSKRERSSDYRVTF